jgi:hypothetical protein
MTRFSMILLAVLMLGRAWDLSTASFTPLAL